MKYLIIEGAVTPGTESVCTTDKAVTITCFFTLFAYTFLTENEHGYYGLMLQNVLCNMKIPLNNYPHW